MLLYSLLAALYVLALQLAALIDNLGASGFGALLAMSGLGMAIGAVVIAQLGHRFSRRRLTATGLGTITWTLVLLSQLRGSLIFTLSLCGILGIGAALVAIRQTTIQEETPETERGRVFGLQNNLINIALSLPLVLAGTLVSSIGLQPVLWLLAGLALVAALIERRGNAANLPFRLRRPNPLGADCVARQEVSLLRECVLRDQHHGGPAQTRASGALHPFR